MAETKYNPSSSGYTSDRYYAGFGEGQIYFEFQYRNAWSTSTSTIIQGNSITWGEDDYYNCNYYGIIYFDFAAIRAKNATHRPVGIRLRLKSHTGASRMLYVHMGKGMAKDSYVSGTRPVNADNGEGGTLTYKNVTCAANSWCELSTTDADWLKALVDSDTTCFYINRYATGHEPWEGGGDYWEGDGALTSNKPELYIDWIPREPNPTPPIPDAPGTITGDLHRFTVTPGSDVVFPASQLSYEFRFSFDGGVSWGDVFTSPQGQAYHDINVRNYLGLQAGQYYYNPGIVQVRTKTPLYGGVPYYSSEWPAAPWVAFWVDYRIIPSVPTSLSVSKANPYEGEQITFTVGAPAQANAYRADGGVNELDYHIRLADGTQLIHDYALATAPSKALAYTVAALTTGLTDLSTYVTAWVNDTAMQTSPHTAPLALTIKRFRAPRVIVENVEREEASAVIHLLVTDTGYGGTQSSSQINKIEYRLDGGAWNDATLLGWDGLKNSFEVTGLSAAARYTLEVRIVNNAPGGTSLTNITGSAHQSLLLEYLPQGGIYKNKVTGVGVVYAQAGIIGSDPLKSVNPGDCRVENDIYAQGDKKVWHEGNDGTGSGLDADTLDGMHWNDFSVDLYYGDSIHMDDAKTSGTYGVYGRAEAPSGSIGVLQVMAYSPDWVVQKWYPIDSSNSSGYQRMYHSGSTWTAWKPL